MLKTMVEPEKKPIQTAILHRLLSPVDPNSF